MKAFNKKGKIFLTFTSNLTEPIKTMFVTGNDMILCGNHVYNHYRDCKDIGSYLCGDTIVDVVVVCPNNVSSFVFISGKNFSKNVLNSESSTFFLNPFSDSKSRQIA